MLKTVTPALCGGLETKMNKQYYVYILTKGRNSTFYVGMTSNLAKRIWEHKNKIADGFTKQYNINQLVYYETFDDPENMKKFVNSPSTVMPALCGHPDPRTRRG